MPHAIIGWIHFIAAIIALITGTMILAGNKGSTKHKITGRIYGINMLIVCATFFMIYRVHGSLGVLHIFAFISTATLLLGMLPLYTNWFKQPMISHLSWMYWSVIGLYCAFSAELFTRLPSILNLGYTYGIFYALVGISSGLTGYIGMRFFKKKFDGWVSAFAKAEKTNQQISSDTTQS
jgi:uncharacterized membrane protein